MAKFKDILVASNEQIKKERANLIINSTKRADIALNETF